MYCAFEKVVKYAKILTTYNTEVKITCEHQSFSVCFIRMTDHIYAWLVGLTKRKVFIFLAQTPTPFPRNKLHYGTKCCHSVCSMIIEHFVN